MEKKKKCNLNWYGVIAIMVLMFIIVSIGIKVLSVYGKDDICKEEFGEDSYYDFDTIRNMEDGYIPCIETIYNNHVGYDVLRVVEYGKE